jgi:hypothetical protein
MEKENKKWEEEIRSKLYDYEADTLPGDWEAISGKLDKKPAGIIPFRRYGYFAAAAVIILLLGGGLMFFNPNDRSRDDSTLSAEKVSPEAASGEDSSPVDVENLSADIEDKADNTMDAPKMIASSNNRNTVNNDKQAASARRKVETLSYMEEIPARVRPLEIEDMAGIAEVLKNADNYISGLIINEKSDNTGLVASNERKVSRTKRWGLGMAGGGTSLGASSSGAQVGPSSAILNDNNFMVLRKVATYSGGRSGMALSNEAADERVYANNRNSSYPENSKIKHRIPISAGLGVNCYLNDRWTLSSGLVYSLLRSDMDFYNELGVPVEGKQKLHFLGLPLSASYKIAEWKKLRVYSTTGGMIEYNISGKLDKTIRADGFDVVETDDLRIKKPYFSLNTRLGLSYPVWRFISVYGEAGASYYFDNNSYIKTIRSDKSFNVSLQAGISLNF